MPLVKLTSDNLGDIHEGRARLLIRDLLKAIFEDIEARGRDGKPRELNVKVTMTPMGDEVEFDLQASAKLPAHRTGTNRGTLKMSRTEGANATLGLFFRDDSDDVNQPVIDDGDSNQR